MTRKASTNGSAPASYCLGELELTKLELARYKLETVQLRAQQQIREAQMVAEQSAAEFNAYSESVLRPILGPDADLSTWAVDWETGVISQAPEGQPTAAPAPSRSPDAQAPERA